MAMTTSSPAALAAGQGSVRGRSTSVTVGPTTLRKLSEMSGHQDTTLTGKMGTGDPVSTAKISQMNGAQLTNVRQVSSRYIY